VILIKEDENSKLFKNYYKLLTSGSSASGASATGAIVGAVSLLIT
jgi:hypothetical protein